MAVQSAGARVANTFELLEPILVHVKSLHEHDCSNIDPSERKIIMRKMLKMQKVSHAFYKIIAGSDDIKRFLFMTAPEPHVRSALDYVPDWNGLLRGAPILRTEAVPFYFTWELFDTKPKMFLSPSGTAAVKDDSKHYDYVQVRVLIRPVPGSGASRATCEASWRSMYLYQSDYKVFDLRTSGGSPGSQRTARLDTLNPTAGELYDALFRES